MPSSLIVVGLVVAWLVVLVPMVVRKRQEIARTTDTALAARVVRAGSHSADAPEDEVAADESVDDDPHDTLDTLDEFDVDPEDEQAEPRRYRPGRGGYDPEAAARAARAKYGFRQRIVLLMLLAAIATGAVAGLVEPLFWWLHGVVDLTLVAYLSYLRRQVRIEQEIRERRAARMSNAPRRSHARPAEDHDHVTTIPTRSIHPGAVVVELDDEDPWFDELGEPAHHTYRRAVGE
ncbi:divisome protein SepX/GlpR [Actinokineospora globicatena]|uniref:divisome protein SepX/GlpR n=1 Tax=Actinokineospora globicatena TaxID=103729 RepID=UPI0020A261AA|nr:gephyrin-like molybdotransferase receptor GlpR [Actinokineospora globicatena]MCP2300672.1 hypothetical protein [Actinokineospora globicatena]GLW81216.1 hypothetical protein Aglo01_56970 [Actinokineospora globicatena]GLW89176.1 hypothetical protein Aglo02_68150 [Actinokineospora globicatena]